MSTCLDRCHIFIGFASRIYCELCPFVYEPKIGWSWLNQKCEARSYAESSHRFNNNGKIIYCMDCPLVYADGKWQPGITNNNDDDEEEYDEDEEEEEEEEEYPGDSLPYPEKDIATLDRELESYRQQGMNLMHRIKNEVDI